jgi:hypothetical protein
MVQSGIFLSFKGGCAFFYDNCLKIKKSDNTDDNLSKGGGRNDSGESVRL